MTGIWLLDTAVLAVSLFNTMLLLWLGIVVLAGSDRRSWGIWLAGGGLMCGGIFFLVHTAIVGRGLRYATADLDALWHFGWVPIIASPLAWYVVLLWYSGFLGNGAAGRRALRRVHVPGLALTLAGAALLVWLVLGADALPGFEQVVALGRQGREPLPGTPLLVNVYALYNIACLALSLHALAEPGPSARWMGELARKRARPYLTGASLVLLVVSVMVSTFIVLLYFVPQALAANENILRGELAWFDLLVGTLIAAAVVLIGKAAVSYEIFTGKVLPRRGFSRQWRRAVILAAGYSALTGAILTLSLPSVYALLLATALVVTFYALLSTRLFGERERVVRELRPFLEPGAGRAASAGSGENLRGPFDSLCARVLNVSVGYLVPRVPFAAPLSFPAKGTPPLEVMGELETVWAGNGTNGARAVATPVQAARSGGAEWAVPLWSERGLLGALLLGERSDGGLFTQEEIEIAQATGERVLEAQASAELTRRLIELQRGRLATTQVMDRRARQTLHDDILPQLHTTLLELAAASSARTENGRGTEELRRALAQLSEVHRNLSNLLREMPVGVSPELERNGVVGALKRSVEQEFGGAFDAVEWELDPQAETRGRDLSALNGQVVYAAAREAVRNAARHGRGGDGARALHLHIAARWCKGLELEIEDDGAGLTSNGRGTGQGVQLHSTMMAVIGGELTLERVRDRTQVRLFLPEGAIR